MLIKRWISLAVFGMLMVSMGFVVIISERNNDNRAWAGMIIVMGIVCVIFSVKRILKSFVTALLPETAGDDGMVEKIYARRILEKGPKIVVVGGGTGLSTLLTGLKQKTSNITAIVTVADEGGSSGRLREEYDVLPPGDIRNCLVALADSEDLLGALFQYRFKEGKELKGHNFGNIFITALSQVTGDFARAVKESSKVLAIRGQVLPATLDKVRLVVRRANGKETIGEVQIREEKESPIEELYLSPRDCKATPESLKAIREADVVVLGPGSLFTSVMPNLMIEGIQKELIKSNAVKMYICNVMTELGETDGYSVSDHVKIILKHTRPGIVQHCIADVSHIPGDIYLKYKEKEQFQVKLDSNDEKWFKREGINLVKEKFASVHEFVRHNPVKLADVIMNIVSE